MKAFVSSTFQDLKDCRKEVAVALRRLDLEDVAMEYFVAEDQRPSERCYECIQDCDLYIGLIAWRYGWIPEVNNPQRLSITHLEYCCARKNLKPCLIFLQDGAAPWPLDLADVDRAKIQAFRQEIQQENQVGWFRSHADIGGAVTASLVRFLKRAETAPAWEEFDLAKYSRALSRKYGQLELEALTPTDEPDQSEVSLASVFVEQSVRENQPPLELPKDITETLLRRREIRIEDLSEGVAIQTLEEARAAYYESPAIPVLDVLTNPAYQQTVVLGDPGSGKSTLMRYFTLALLNPEVEPRIAERLPDGVPFLLQLRYYALERERGRCRTPLEYIAHVSQVESWHLGYETIHARLNTGRAVVIFDGLDEIFDPEMREQTSRQIVDFAVDYPRVRVIVTTRVIGYQRRIFASGAFGHVTLQDFNEHQILTFLERWYAKAYASRPDEGRARLHRILTSLQQSSSLRQLAGNPMLLTIMAMLGRRRELPQERHKLYQHAAGILIEYWDINRHLRQRDILANIGEDQKTELLRRIAAAMQHGGSGLAGNHIHQEALRSEVKAYLRECLPEAAGRAEAIAQAVIHQLRQRNFILSKYGGDFYGFVHRGFLEYFCALYYKEAFERKQTLPIDRLKFEVYGRHWVDRSWHEVLRLICAMVHERFAAEIIDYLLTEVYSWESPVSSPHYPWRAGGDEVNEGGPEEEPEFFFAGDFYRPFPWNVALAVQCLAEVGHPMRIAATAQRVLRTVCALYDYCMSRRPELKEFLVEHIVPYLEQVGEQWPLREEIADWLAARPRGESDWAWLYAELFGRFVGAVGRGSQRIFEAVRGYLDHEEEDRRVLAVFALAFGWSDSVSTIEGLHQRAREDAEPDVRWATISALGAYHRDDPATAVLIENRAGCDESAQVRAVACRLLGLYFKDGANTLPTLAERATGDLDFIVRKAALETLAEAFPASPETRRILEDRARNDADPRLRDLAQAAAGGRRAPAGDQERKWPDSAGSA